MGQVLKIGSKKLSLENWKVHHPNGKHMFTCGEKKADWYLSNGLAELIDEYTIQLNFEPKGDGYDLDNVFGLSNREVRCVVTGIRDELQRHHVVPYCYRTHLPAEFKSKNHHDVVLIHYLEHQKYELFADEHKDYMAEQYGIKTLSELSSEYSKMISDYAFDNRRVISKLHSLFNNYGNIPNEVVLDNLEYVSKVTGISFDYLINMNYIQLYKLYLFFKETHHKELEKYKEINRIKYDHGYQLVSQLQTDEEIEDFIKSWRKHFIETMNPQYMPNGWSIDFRCKVDL